MNSFERLSNFAIRQVVDAPIAEQVLIYRAIADLTPDLDQAAELNRMANDLQAIGERQLELRFRAIASGCRQFKKR